MTCAMYLGPMVQFAGSVDMPPLRGRLYSGHMMSLENQSLPTDPIGTTTVTFSGVNANSEIRIYLPDGTEVAGVEDCVANQVLTWPVYAGGSANNTVRITILLRGYRIQKFNYTVALGVQTLPIFQIVDLGYLNPA